MKRISFLFTLCFATICMFAQDVIITTDEQKIEAKILEVSTKEVRYKKASNPDGPIFILESTKIATIIYENGDVQVFKHRTPEKRQQMVQLDRNLYQYGNLLMNETDYLEFLKKNCPIAYNQHREGIRKVHSGVGCFVGGLVASLAGTTMWCLGSQRVSAGSRALTISGIVLVSVGTPFIITCIPIWAEGNSERRNSVNTFNKRCAPSGFFSMSLNVQLSNGGLGLALNF